MHANVIHYSLPYSFYLSSAWHGMAWRGCGLGHGPRYLLLQVVLRV